MSNVERFDPPSESGLFIGMGFSEEVPRYTGDIFWELRDEKTGDLIDSGVLRNIVTKDASILIARLMKSPSTPNTSEPSFGIFALAVGTGDVGWDPLNPPAATNTQRSLYNEIGRKQVSSASFIDANGNISSIPTNIVDFTVVFSSAEAVGALTEMGMLGGDVDPNMAVTNPILPPNGTYDPTVDVRGKDILGNYKTFSAISKPLGSTLAFTWRFTF